MRISHWVFVAALCIATLSLGARPTAAAPPASRAAPRVLLVDTRLHPDKPSNALRRIERALKELHPGLQFETLPWQRLASKSSSLGRFALVVLSPQGDPWWQYPQAELQQLLQTVRALQRPTLGICGGHQLLAMAHGGSVAPIQRLRPGNGYDGLLHVKGWVSVTPTADSSWIPAACRVHESHREEVKSLGPTLRLVALSAGDKVEAIEVPGRPIRGVQFHPEAWTAGHACGRAILLDMLATAGLKVTSGRKAQAPGRK